jgi:hypothetical protein
MAVDALALALDGDTMPEEADEPAVFVAESSLGGGRRRDVPLPLPLPLPPPSSPPREEGSRALTELDGPSLYEHSVFRTTQLAHGGPCSSH